MPIWKSSQRGLSLEVLEKREVLSTNLPIGTDLVENGDFETLEGNFAQDWIGSTDEVSAHEFAGRPERGQVALVPQDNSITQSIDVIDGQKYILAFDFRLARAAAEGQVSVNNGEKVVSATDRWQTAATSIVADSNSIFITLDVFDGDVFVDCVRLIPIEDILLSNGSFEDQPNDQDDRFSSNEFGGWNSVGDPESENLNLMRGDASHGNASLVVDGNADIVDRIFQLVETEPGQKFFASFDVKGSGNGGGIDNLLRVRWNEEFKGSFEATTQWQTFGFVADANTDLARMLFREVGGLGGTGDGTGPLIDNVELFRIIPGMDSLTITEPDPQAREFVEDGGPVGLVSVGLDITNSVNNLLTGAEVKIQNQLDQPGDEILNVFTGDTAIDASFDAAEGLLRLSGNATLEEYEAVIRSVTYENLSQNPDTTTRNVRLTVDYAKAFSESIFVDVNISGVNDRPTMRPVADQSITVLTSLQTQVDASDVDDPDAITYSISATGTALGQNDPGPTISDSGLIEWLPQQSGNAQFTVTVEDPEGRIVRRSFNVSAVLDADVPSNFAPFSGARQLSNVVPSLRNDVYEQAPAMNIDLSKEYRAIFHTDKGEIEVLLSDNDTPITVNNFVNLARDGYYDGLTFQRVQSLINSATEGFIAQGGDPLGTGAGGPGYQFADENLQNSIFDTPVIAMANRGPATNGGQFFLTFDDQVQHLNGSHTIFGVITRGLDVVNTITKRQPDSSIPAEVIRQITITEI